ncbi:hypothetical protein MKZ38_007938 [Zalerion maritima]|uniref:Uncharacterized protein n=1 Tax=Zalerion maritima TaxID=339359 RepID=A0AAD5RUI0_9PEZI|nr:hypothetical protein MKZ38_007938 [Zalerion maritima]
MGPLGTVASLVAIGQAIEVIAKLVPAFRAAANAKSDMKEPLEKVETLHKLNKGISERLELDYVAVQVFALASHSFRGRPSEDGLMNILKYFGITHSDQGQDRTNTVGGTSPPLARTAHIQQSILTPGIISGDMKGALEIRSYIRSGADLEGSKTAILKEPQNIDSWDKFGHTPLT